MARRRAGLSQRELARRSRIPQPSISRIERGRVSPTVDTLERLLRPCRMELEPVDVPGEAEIDWAAIRERLAMSPPERVLAATADWRRLQARRRRARRLVREYRENDRAALVAHMDAFGEELAAMDPVRRLIRIDGYGEALVAAMLQEASRVFVAEAAGRVVAFGAANLHERSGRELVEVPAGVTGRITELYVEPRRRGRSLGLALLEALEEHLRESRCDVVRIELFAANRAATRFYERVGYEIRDVDLLKLL